LVVAIVIGSRSLADIELLAHQAAVSGAPASDSTVRRMPAELDAKSHARIQAARAKVRAHVWELIAARDSGFCWVAIAGRVLTGWIAAGRPDDLPALRSGGILHEYERAA
jgi:hypothetical protein